MVPKLVNIIFDVFILNFLVDPDYLKWNPCIDLLLT